MSNGQRCCAAGVCCPPPAANAQEQDWDDWRADRRAAIAALIIEGDATVTQTQAGNAAEYLMGQLGFVPIGVDVEIARAYRPLFVEALE